MTHQYFSLNVSAWIESTTRKNPAALSESCSRTIHYGTYLECALASAGAEDPDVQIIVGGGGNVQAIKP